MQTFGQIVYEGRMKHLKLNLPWENLDTETKSSYQAGAIDLLHFLDAQSTTYPANFVPKPKHD